MVANYNKNNSSEYFKSKKNRLRMLMYFFLVLGIFYHTLSINNSILDIYNWENNILIKTNNKELNYNMLEINYNPYTENIIDMNLTLSGIVFSIVWNLIGLFLCFVVVIYLWVNEIASGLLDESKNN